MKQASLSDYLADIYLDWFNNFLTREKFADHYDITLETANALIIAGAIEHERRVINHKQSA